MRSLLLAILFALLPAVASASPLKLNSGKIVEIEAVGPMYFTKAKPALALRYRTQLSIDDLNAVRKEVDEIWQYFVIDADRGKFETALIMANGPQTGFIIKTGKSYNFGFGKIGGVWRAIEPQTDANTKLTEERVRSFLERWDFLLLNYNTNAVALYLAPSWQLKVPNAPDGITEIPRKQFIDELGKDRGKTELVSYRRDILSVTIDAKTNTARVRSRETTARRSRTTAARLVELVVDDIVLKDQTIMIVSSSTTIENLSGAAPAR